MKRALLVITLVALAFMACAQTIVRETQVVVGWDAPGGTTAGDPLLPDDQVSYRVWVEDLIRGTRTLAGETASLEFAVTVPYRSVWRVGVSAVLDGTESEVAWSNVDVDVAEAGTFLLRPLGAPGRAVGLRVQSDG